MEQQLRWLTVEEACDRARCGRKAIYSAVKSKRLKAARINERGDLRFDPGWVDKWVEDCASRDWAA